MEPGTPLPSRGSPIVRHHFLGGQAPRSPVNPRTISSVRGGLMSGGEHHQCSSRRVVPGFLHSSPILAPRHRSMKCVVVLAEGREITPPGFFTTGDEPERSWFSMMGKPAAATALILPTGVYCDQTLPYGSRSALSRDNNVLLGDMRRH